MVCKQIYKILVITKKICVPCEGPRESLTETRGSGIKTKHRIVLHTENKYISLWVRKDRVRPLVFKVYNIQVIDSPTKLRDV